MQILNKSKKIYFIGIGGIGMSGIAEILYSMGFNISGSDTQENNNISRLKKLGIKVKIGHNKKNIIESDLVVYSSAIKKENVELKKAKSLNLPILKRAKILAEIMKLKSSITIAGSHGKTTTTSIIACLLEEGKLDPTVINGGIINKYGTNAKLGKGKWIVAEADESDGSFIFLPSTICLINNIDPEHLDFYKNFNKLKESFLLYARHVPFFGFISLCIDHKNVKSLVKSLADKTVVSYGFSNEANVHPINVKINEIKGIYYSQFDVRINFKKIRIIKGVKIPILGDHNIRNTLGAISIGVNLGLKNQQIKSALKKFKGVKRRFTLVLKINKNKVFDDYAHHPKEIIATLETLKKITPGKIIAIHEPHRYSRLKELYNEFTSSFDDSHILFILPVYPAGEKKLINYTSQKLVSSIRKNNKEAFYSESNKKLFDKIYKFLKPDDNVIFLGAGPITKLAYEFGDYLKNKNNKI